LRVGVIQKENRRRLSRLAKGVDQELRSQGGAADADEQDALEARRRPGDEGGDPLLGRADVGSHWLRSDLGPPEPVMTDGALLIAIDETALLDLGHLREGRVDL